MVVKIVNPSIPAEKGVLRFICERCKTALELEESDLHITTLSNTDKRKTTRYGRDVWYGCCHCQLMNVVTLQVSRKIKSRLIAAAKAKNAEIHRQNELRDAEPKLLFQSADEIVARLCTVVDSNDLRRYLYIPYANNISKREDSGRGIQGILWLYTLDLSARFPPEVRRVIAESFVPWIRALIDDDEIYEQAIRSHQAANEAWIEGARQMAAHRIDAQRSN